MYFLLKNHTTLSKMDKQTDLDLVYKAVFYQRYVSFFFFPELLNISGLFSKAIC